MIRSRTRSDVVSKKTSRGKRGIVVSWDVRFWLCCCAASLFFAAISGSMSWVRRTRGKDWRQRGWKATACNVVSMGVAYTGGCHKTEGFSRCPVHEECEQRTNILWHHNRPRPADEFVTAPAAEGAAAVAAVPAATAGPQIPATPAASTTPATPAVPAVPTVPGVPTAAAAPATPAPSPLTQSPGDASLVGEVIGAGAPERRLTCEDAYLPWVLVEVEEVKRCAFKYGVGNLSESVGPSEHKDPRFAQNFATTDHIIGQEIPCYVLQEDDCPVALQYPMDDLETGGKPLMLACALCTVAGVVSAVALLLRLRHDKRPQAFKEMDETESEMQSDSLTE